MYCRVVLCGFLALALLASIPTAPAADPKTDDPVFHSVVEPVLAKHCWNCHGADKQKAGLDLRSREKLLAGSQSGPVLVPGKAGESLLLQLVSPKGKPHMPPKGQLSAQELAGLTKWIDSLKPVNREIVITDKDRAHWAFRPLVQAVPPSGEAWGRTPIDRFILVKLQAAGLAPAPPAAKVNLLRRAYFDLIGLPPTPEEVSAALGDPSEEWYEKVIDRLLASPHYGERWGRHWLDLARYADSGGFEFDIDRPHAWRYRDYVIQSFNEDKPYGQFLREQLAGDELAPHDAQALIATGFCCNGPTVGNAAGENYRLDELDDVISTTSAVFLGLTIGCARCHDHKFDPLPQKDYYRLLAVFNSTNRKDTPLPGRDRAAKPETALAMTETGPQPRKTQLLWRGDHRTPGPEVEPGVPLVLVKEALHFPKPEAGAKTTGRRRVLADWLASPDNALVWRVMANRVWQYHFGRGLVASSSNFGSNGGKPSHPELLDWLAGQLIAHGGRLKPLHKLIMTSNVYRQAAAHHDQAAQLDPENTLLWRYRPRRLEAEPIRDSILMVAGTLNPRMGGPGIKPRIHPSVIATGSTKKWPEVKQEGPEHWRRSVYVFVKRSVLLPLLDLFDAPPATQTCSQRTVSTVPTQALVLMNDDFISEQAIHFAERVRQEVGDEPLKQTERALWLALAKPPAGKRVSDLADFLLRQRQAYQGKGRSAAEASQLALTDLCHVLFNCNEFVYCQ